MHQFGCRIRVHGEGVYMGVALQSKVVANRFKHENWLHTGHGNYLVGADGYIYSHSDKGLNQKHGGLHYDVGDVVTVLYDAKEQILRVSCGQK